MDSIKAIVLCGGLGTRLRAISGELPKPMVKIATRPFLEYILDYLLSQGVKQVILAVSYQKEFIIEHFAHKYKALTIQYSIESTPLGTGGAIKKILEENQDHQSPFLIINGDTLVEYNLSDMHSKLQQESTKLVMSIKQVEDTGRYGRVSIAKDSIIAFEEKKQGLSGFINTGVYLIPHCLLADFPAASYFSFEKDYLEQKIQGQQFLHSITKGYFIDIGIPKDYHQAQMDFASIASSQVALS